MQNSAAGEKEPAAGVENAVCGKSGGPSSFQAFGWADVPQGSMRSLQELQWLGTLTQAVGLLAFMAAWAAAEPAYRYDRVLIGGLCGLMVAGLLAIRLMKTPVSMFLTTLVTVLLLAEAFARLAAASPASTVWCFVLGIVFSLVMAPLFFNMAQYATAFVTVWLVLSRGRWLCLSEGRDACWSMLLLGAVAVIGFFLSFSFSRLRHASARQRLALEAMAYQDSLTGLANRRRLMERLQLLQGDGRLRHAHFLMIDVDDFKQINDRSGHEHGDTVLKALAALLRAQAGPHRAVRLGGEEFGVLMETGDRHEACALARRLVDAAHALARYPADAAPASCAGLTISIGVAAGQAGDLPRDLLRRSDQALYAAKQAGKDRFMADAGAWPAPADDDAGPSSPRAWMARVDRRKPVP